MIWRDHPGLTVEALQEAVEREGRASLEQSRATWVRGRAIAVMLRDHYQAEIDGADEILQRYATVLDQGGAA